VIILGRRVWLMLCCGTLKAMRDSAAGIGGVRWAYSRAAPAFSSSAVLCLFVSFTRRSSVFSQYHRRYSPRTSRRAITSLPAVTAPVCDAVFPCSGSSRKEMSRGFFVFSAIPPLKLCIVLHTLRLIS